MDFNYSLFNITIVFCKKYNLKSIMLKKTPKLFYCPVPVEQRPLNEYLSLKGSIIFNLPTLNSKEFFKRNTFITSLILIFFLPITNYFYPITEFPIHFFLTNILIVTNSLVFLFTRIHLGWSYIEKRLLNPTVEYEESGWYDGQVWVKPIKILKQDRLICSYKVYPVLKRLKKIIVYLFTVSITIFLINFLF